MGADPKFDAPLGRQAGIALGHAVLHLDRATHRVDHAAKLDKNAVPSALDDAPVMRVDGGIDQVAAQPTEPRQRAILVRPCKTAVADNIRDQNRRDFADSPPWRTLWASLRLARKPDYSGAYSWLTCAPASIAKSACASAISGISGVGAKPSRAGARTAHASDERSVD
jgi:hypothetical protein